MADRSRRAFSGNTNGAFRERIAASGKESGTAAVGGRLLRHKVCQALNYVAAVCLAVVICMISMQRCAVTRTDRCILSRP